MSDDPAAPRSLRIERSGGFAGLKASVDLDCATLTPAQRSALDTLLRKTSARAVPPGAAASAPVREADRFSYRLHLVDADGGQRTIAVSEDEMPAALEALAKPSLP